MSAKDSKAVQPQNPKQYWKSSEGWLPLPPVAVHGDPFPASRKTWRSGLDYYYGERFNLHKWGPSSLEGDVNLNSSADRQASSKTNLAGTQSGCQVPWDLAFDLNKNPERSEGKNFSKQEPFLLSELCEHVRRLTYMVVGYGINMAGAARPIEARTTTDQLRRLMQKASAAVCYHTGRGRVWNNAGVRIYQSETTLGLSHITKVGLYNRTTGEEYTSEDLPNPRPGGLEEWLEEVR